MNKKITNLRGSCNKSYGIASLYLSQDTKLGRLDCFLIHTPVQVVMVQRKLAVAPARKQTAKNSIKISINPRSTKGDLTPPRGFRYIKA